MIEKWLQFTCDRCDDVDNSVAPNMTIVEFRKDARIHRYNGHDLCHGCWIAVVKEGAEL